MKTTAALSLFVPFAACSSGGGDTTSQVTTPTVRITAENAIQVAAAAYGGAFDLLRVVRIGASFLTVPPPAPTSPAALVVLPGTVVQTVAGPEGGEAVFTWNDIDEDGGYTTGDTFAIAFSDYGDAGLLLTGAVLFGSVVTTGDVLEGLSWTIAARLEFVGLRVTANGEAATLNGSLACEREQRVTVALLSVDLDAKLEFAGRTLAAGNSMARTDYVLDFSQGLFADGSVEDALLGGVLAFRTEGPLTGIQALPDPSAGRMEVEGDGSSLAIIPIDLFNCELHIDADGDGEAETILPVEWTAL